MPLQRRILFLMFICLSINVFNGCKQKKVAHDAEIADFKELRELFINPPAAYRSVPLWNWNGKITKEEIALQLKEFKNAGIGGVFVHPRPGLINAYLSDEWFELFKYTVEEGKELDMDVWIYDENSYPSGFAGGHVPAEMPESYNQGIALVPEIQNQLIPDERKAYKIILKKEGEQFVDITNDVEQENGKKGKYYLYSLLYPNTSPWFGGFSYVDLLHDSVTEKFIELTMKGYEKYTGDEFGKVLPGIFTDEPNIARGTSAEAIRWTPRLFEQFKARWGYELQTALPMLSERTGEWKKVRHNYYQVLLEMFIDRWAAPWYNYCEENNLEWTGHYWEHGWPSPGHGGDNMAMYAWHQIPGIDMLGNEFDENGIRQQFGNIRSVKELRSAANQTGRTRTLSETYGGGGWNMTFRDFKYLGDWQYVLGVNFLNQHKSDYTLAGVRKFDYPPSFSYHEPWFEHYDVQGDYFARLSVALSAGKQINHTLIIEPTTTAWMYHEYVPTNTWRSELPDKLKKIARSFQHFLLKIEREQYEYDLGSENIIKHHGSVENNLFVVGEQKYSLIVLPPGIENLDRNTFLLLKQYLQNGGQVLAFVDQINFIDGNVTEEVISLQEKHEENWHVCKRLVSPKVDELMLADDFNMLVPGIIGGKLYHQRRILDDGQLIFFANASTKEYAGGEGAVKGKELVRLDMENGRIYRYPATSSGEKLHFSINIPPTGSLMLFAASDEVSAEQEPVLKETQVFDHQKIELIHRKQPNVLGLDYLDVTFGNTKLEDVYFFVAMDSLFKSYGFEHGNPWFHAVQYKSDIIERDTFSADSKFEVTYHFQTDQEMDENTLRQMKLVVERPTLWEVFINQEKAGMIPDEWFIDRSFAVFDIGHGVKNGDNTITLKAPKMSVHAEIQPVYILGEFAVVPGQKGFLLTEAEPLELGSWKEQGLPWYQGEVVYSKTFGDVTENRTYKLRLGKWSGSLVAVSVNEEHAGIIASEPYELDVTDFLHAGENNIAVTVYSTLRNIFGPKHKNNRGFSSPWDWMDAPYNQPAGAEYDAVDYGLFSEFYLIEYMEEK